MDYLPSPYTDWIIILIININVVIIIIIYGLRTIRWRLGGGGGGVRSA